MCKQELLLCSSTVSSTGTDMRYQIIYFCPCFLVQDDGYDLTICRTGTSAGGDDVHDPYPSNTILLFALRTAAVCTIVIIVGSVSGIHVHTQGIPGVEQSSLLFAVGFTVRTLK